ncbi:MAG: ATP-binding protein [Gammaproteobacteria bacterium]|nr:ATP-binding protein [Gammaproteobacteria bacterium]
MYSLRGRLLLWVSGLLILFFGLTAFGLDLAFRHAGERAVQDVLDVRVIMLLAAAEPDGLGLAISSELPDPRFAQTGSGLYAELLNSSGKVLWRSASSTGLHIVLEELPLPGSRIFRRVEASDGSAYLDLIFGVEWEFDDGRVESFAVQVAENLDAYNAQVNRFRRQMGSWFLASLLLLLLSVALLMRRVLRPLNRIEREIDAVERGQAETLGSGYPRELEPLTRNMNALILSERQRLQRYRHALGDLAHSLKTPLAVVRSQLNGDSQADTALLDRQVARMDEIIRYQLQRAAAVGSGTLGRKQLDAVQVARGVVEALDKVYADKTLRHRLDLPVALPFHGEQGDLMEILGNLLDNAYKYCDKQLVLTMGQIPAGDAGKPGLRIQVEDDGTGFPEGLEETLLQRGVRADERNDGQGIGLAVVRELALAYRGSLEVGRSALGGGRVVVVLPGV